jgi:enoyl-CoA hydratase/carnithine racemase
MSAVIVERDGAVLTATLNRPEKRNAINAELSSQLAQALSDADADPDVRAVIITGAGSAFCSGMDLQAFASGAGPSETGRLFRGGLTTPVIAAVNGPAVAGGLELMLACDLAIASDAARFGVPEVLRGLFAGAGATWRLPRTMGSRAAMEMLLTGRLVDATRALELGLVNRVVPPDQVLPAARELAEAVAAASPMGIAHTLTLARAAFDVPEAELWERNAASWREVSASADAREGALAFVEKRVPRWIGR